jgi:hypothetical protein
MGDQFTGYIIANSEKESDRYRWYLCVEKQLESWRCHRVSQETALLHHDEHKRTKAIPIHYTNPPFLDSLYIRAALQPTVKIIKPACAERGPE